MLQLFLGQIPEAIYFSLFMIYAKGIKEKRILFTILMIAEYLLLIHIFPQDIWFHILYTISTFIILKILYKEKAQITDIFTFIISSILMILISVPTFFIFNYKMKNVLMHVIADRILLFAVLFLLKNKLYNIQKLYKKFWNRNDSVKKKMKTTTFRAINVIVFNFIFYILNIILLYSIFIGGRR